MFFQSGWFGICLGAVLVRTRIIFDDRFLSFRLRWCGICILTNELEECIPMPTSRLRGTTESSGFRLSAREGMVPRERARSANFESTQF
jgi:hypothetical protein